MGWERKEHRREFLVKCCSSWSNPLGFSILFHIFHGSWNVFLLLKIIFHFLLPCVLGETATRVSLNPSLSQSGVVTSCLCASKQSSAEFQV